MQSYLDDPRNFPSRFEYPTTIGGAAEMYQWQATLCDLSDLPESEYMKPMTVIAINGSQSGTPVTKEEKVNIYMSVIDPDGRIFPNSAVTETATGKWRTRWQWVGDFIGSIAVATNVMTDEDEYLCSSEVSDNVAKKIEKEIEISSSETVVEVSSYGVAAANTEPTEISAKTYTEKIDNINTTYIYNVSRNEYVIYLKLTYIIDGEEKYSINNMKYGQAIPSYSGSTEKEGYIFLGWANENGELFTGTTMPSKSLNLYAKYEEIETDSPLYYGAVLNGIITSATNLTSAFTSTFEDGEVVTITVPKDEFYASKQDDEEWIRTQEEAYKASHKYPVILLLTKEVSNNYTITAMEGIIPVVFTKMGSITISGIEYDKYQYGTDNMCASVEDQTWIFTITLVRK